MKEMNIFLSYCWADSEIADNIYDYFKNQKSIELHRDVIDIGTWGSIKEYMQSISDMDYIILLISDAYLKSVNCMYEVLEVMRDRNFRKKVFPAIINPEIYKAITRAGYVKYWENQFKELDEVLRDIHVQNLGKLTEDLKRCQDISSNIAEFLDVVSDMNNPMIEDVAVSIDEKLKQNGLLNQTLKQIDKNDLFATLGIEKTKIISEPTDLEINRFMKESYRQVVSLLTELCTQYEKENSEIQINIEHVDTRNCICQFYRNGQLVRGLRLFLGNMLDSQEKIGISDCSMSFGGNYNSWNGMYDAKFVDGKLKLDAVMSMYNSQKSMTVEEVVADIWKSYVQPYLDR